GAAQREQVAGLLGLQAERGADSGQDLCRGPNFAGLLQPGVPLGADSGGGGDLLPPKAGRAPAATPRKAQLFGLAPHPPGLEEVGDLPSAFVAQHGFSSCATLVTSALGSPGDVRFTRSPPAAPRWRFDARPARE